MAGMLRISPVQREDGGVMLHVEGKLAGEWVAVLERTCGRWLAGAHNAVGLDLAGVNYVDNNAVALLLDLRKDGVVLTGLSAFVQARLSEGGA